MLVLTRKSNQSIMIGDDIEVSVLAIMGEKVRIGIQAPREVPVFRKEVYLEIQQERASEGYPCADCGTFLCLLCTFRGVTLCSMCQAKQKDAAAK